MPRKSNTEKLSSIDKKIEELQAEKKKVEQQRYQDIGKKLIDSWELEEINEGDIFKIIDEMKDMAERKRSNLDEETETQSIDGSDDQNNSSSDSYVGQQ